MVRDQTTNPDQVEAHRQRNRECMRKARLRQRQRLQDMESTVQQLEKQYAELCQQAATVAQNTEHEHEEDQDQGYARVVAMAKRLGAEKLLLQTMLKEKAEWRRQLQRILDFEASSVTSTQELQGTTAPPLDVVDEAVAVETFGFHPLSEWDFTRMVLNNKQDVLHVSTRLLQSSILDTVKGTQTKRMKAFGWDVIQRVEGSVMEFVSSKSFVGLDVFAIMQKTWMNSIQLSEFKKLKAETRRLQVLQQMNQNACVMVRDVDSPGKNFSTFRSVFVHYLVESTTQLPELASDTYTEGLTGTGYLLGAQSLDTDCLHHSADEETSGKLAWADLAVSIEALDVVNPDTGEPFQHIRWIGRLDYCSEEHAQRDAADTLQCMLRWEMLTVAPALNLISLCLH